MDSTGRSTSRHAASDGWPEAFWMAREKMARLLAEISWGEKMSKMMKMHAAVEEWNLEHDADSRALLGDIRGSAAKEEAARAGGCCWPAEDHRHTVTARTVGALALTRRRLQEACTAGVRREARGADCSHMCQLTETGIRR